MHDKRDPHIERSALRERLQQLQEQHPLAEEILPRRKKRILDVLFGRLASVTVVAENLFDPHNMSAILRSAEGFGVDTLHVVEKPNRYEPNKQIVKGSDKWVEIERYQSLTKVIGGLRDRGFVTIAADVGPGAIPLHEIDVDRPVALVMGTEFEGLSKEAKSISDHRFTIPMNGFVESFNVSVSAAISLYDLTKRRRAHLEAPGDLDEATLGKRMDLWMQRSVSRRRVRQLNLTVK